MCLPWCYRWGKLSLSQDHVWCCGKGDVVKSNKWLTVVVVLVFSPWFRLYKVSSVFILMLHTIFLKEILSFPLMHLLIQLSFTFWYALNMCGNIWKIICFQPQYSNAPFVCVVAYGRIDVVFEVHYEHLWTIPKISFQSQVLHNSNVESNAVSLWCINIAWSWLQYFILM